MPPPTSPQRPRTKNPIKELQAKVAPVFDSVQNSSNSKANMRKHCVQLFQIHNQMSAFQTPSKFGGKPTETGEIKFREAVQGMLARVLTVKKGLPAADRVVCFLGAYTAYINATEFQYEDDPDEETTAHRFTDGMLTWLMEGFNAKDKNVRSGVLKAVSKMLPTLGDIDLDQYESLEESFIDRIQDKDVAVRESAATCLACLLKYDPELKLEENESINLLLESMAHDPATDVRKAIIKDIPIIESTLSAILERTRDTEASVRKYVYDFLREHITEKVMEGEKVAEVMMGPTHPMTLSIDQRELIVENGLQDRVPSVNAAAAALLWEWYGAGNECKVEEQDTTVKIEDPASGIDTGVDAGLAFIRLFDLGTRPESAEEALVHIFKTQKGFANRISLPESYWESITPEKVFFVRALVKHFTDSKKVSQATIEVSQCEDRLDAVLPEVTRIAFFIREQYNQLGQPSNVEEDDLEIATVTLTQLLELAAFLDYSDEIGRRRMHSLVREMLGDLNLSSACMPPCVEVLRLLSSDERDFIRLVVENITDLRACIDESEQSEQPAQQALGEDSGHALDVAPAEPAKEKISPEKKDEIDGKCLLMCINMLKLVDDPIERNSTLDYVVEKLIKPRVFEPSGPHVDIALEAMSLCALISEAKALQMLNFAKDQVPNAPLATRIILYQTLFDIYMVLKYDLFKKRPENLESIPEFLLDRMTVEDNVEVKAILCHGVAKLVGARMVSNDKAFITLVKFYISPYNSGNARLQQCLACFFEDYAKSSSFYQEKLCNVFIHVFLDFCEDLKKLEDEEEEEIASLSSAQVANMFVDWTDPSHPIARNVKGKQIVNSCTHLDLAQNIVKILFEKDLRVEIDKEDKKVLCRLLERLYIPDEVDDCKIRSLAMLLGKLKTLRPLKDSVCRNAVNKFLLAIEKRFAKQLEGITEEELRQLEENQALFDFLDSIIPLDDEDEDDAYAAPRRGRKRRSESVMTSLPATRSSSPRVNGGHERNHRNKRPRLSGSNEPDDDEDEDDSIMCSERSTPMPTVRRPRSKPAAASAASRKNVEVIVISSDSDEGGPPPKRTSKAQLPFRPPVKQEAPLDDEDLNRLLSGASIEKSSTSFDSIMDSEGSNSEEDEEEVTDLLADD